MQWSLVPAHPLLEKHYLLSQDFLFTSSLQINLLHPQNYALLSINIKYLAMATLYIERVMMLM